MADTTLFYLIVYLITTFTEKKIIIDLFTTFLTEKNYLWFKISPFTLFIHRHIDMFSIYY